MVTRDVLKVLKLQEKRYQTSAVGEKNVSVNNHFDKTIRCIGIIFPMERAFESFNDCNGGRIFFSS